MMPEQAGFRFDRSLIPQGNYASDRFIDQYLPLEKESASLQEIWRKFRHQRSGDLDLERNKTESELWSEFAQMAKKWLSTQFELALNEFGVGRPRMMPSYFFVVAPKENGGYKVAPFNTFEFLDMSQSFVDYDTKVGVGLERIYQLAYDSQPGMGLARYSSSELYKQFNSLTDVVEFYQVVDGDGQEKVVEGRYLLLGRKLTSEQKAFVHNYLALRNTLKGQDAGIPTDVILSTTNDRLPPTAETLIQNPTSFDFGLYHSANISDLVEELNYAFERKFGHLLVEQTGVELFQIIEAKIAHIIDELFMATVNRDQITYKHIIGQLLTELQLIWAQTNRPEVKPTEHLYEVIWGQFPMVFAHATTGENLWLFGNPVTNQWYFGNACGGSELGSKWCKKCERFYSGSSCSKCDKSKQTQASL